MSGSSVEQSSNYSWAFMGVSGGSSHFEEHGTGGTIARVHNNGGNADYEGYETYLEGNLINSIKKSLFRILGSRYVLNSSEANHLISADPERWVTRHTHINISGWDLILLL